MGGRPRPRPRPRAPPLGPPLLPGGAAPPADERVLRSEYSGAALAGVAAARVSAGAAPDWPRRAAGGDPALDSLPLGAGDPPALGAPRARFAGGPPPAAPAASSPSAEPLADGDAPRLRPGLRDRRVWRSGVRVAAPRPRPRPRLPRPRPRAPRPEAPPPPPPAGPPALAEPERPALARLDPRAPPLRRRAAAAPPLSLLSPPLSGPAPSAWSSAMSAAACARQSRSTSVDSCRHAQVTRGAAAAAVGVPGRSLQDCAKLPTAC